MEKQKQMLRQLSSNKLSSTIGTNADEGEEDARVASANMQRNQYATTGSSVKHSGAPQPPRDFKTNKTTGSSFTASGKPGSSNMQRAS